MSKAKEILMRSKNHMEAMEIAENEDNTKVEQNYEQETTTFKFEDGSILIFCNQDVREYVTKRD